MGKGHLGPARVKEGSRGHQGMSEFLAPVVWYFSSRGVREIVCMSMLVGGSHCR